MAILVCVTAWDQFPPLQGEKSKRCQTYWIEDPTSSGMSASELILSPCPCWQIRLYENARIQARRPALSLVSCEMVGLRALPSPATGRCRSGRCVSRETNEIMYGHFPRSTWPRVTAQHTGPQASIKALHPPPSVLGHLRTQTDCQVGEPKPYIFPRDLLCIKERLPEPFGKLGVRAHYLRATACDNSLSNKRPECLRGWGRLGESSMHERLDTQPLRLTVHDG